MRAHARWRARTHTHTHTHKYVRACARAHTHTHTHTNTHTNTHTHSLSLSQTHTHTHTHTHIHTLTYAHRSQWSVGHLRPLAIALCSGLLWPFQSSWSVAVSALLQCLASSCCEAGVSSSYPAGSRSGLGVWCWMLASSGCVRSSPTSSAESAWPLVPVPLAPTDLHFGSSPAMVFCRCASDRC